MGAMGKQRSLSLPRAAGLLLVTVAWAVFLSVSGSPEAVLFTLPVFLLAAPLAFGHYVGEELLLALAGHLRATRGGLAPLLRPDGIGPCTGRLEAMLLPGRGPPGINA